MSKGEGEGDASRGSEPGSVSDNPGDVNTAGPTPGGPSQSLVEPESARAGARLGPGAAIKPRYSGLIQTGTAETRSSWTSQGGQKQQVAPGKAHSSVIASAEAKGSGGRVGLVFAVGALLIVVGGIAVFVTRTKRTSPAPEPAKVTPALSRTAPPASTLDVGQIADQALEMVRKDRFAVALGLLEEARAQARTPIEVATLREKEAI